MFGQLLFILLYDIPEQENNNKHVRCYPGDSSLKSSLESDGHDRLQNSVPELPGMPKMKKVSFSSLDSRSQASSPGKRRPRTFVPQNPDVCYIT